MIVHFLNLDIVLGILGGGVFASYAVGMPLPSTWWFVIPGATWCVYTADRLLDAQRSISDYPTLRHQFHSRHRTLLVCSVICVGITTAVVGISTLPWESVLVAILVLFLFGIHHVFQSITGYRWLGALKDLNVVLAYVVAVWSIPILRHTDISWEAYVALAAHTTMVCAAIVLESLPDKKVDEELDQPSIARVLGEGGTRSFLIVSIIALGLCTWLLRSTILWPVSISWMACVAVLPWVVRSRISTPYKRMLVELTLALPIAIKFGY
ncbi:MAG TPA: hypothetical protein VK147_02730 [Candidatus Didemnitutus sp.]|nr:hypothetical protein [Candidatus Didemnitutus sp.]